ncbi:MAG: hypothetical protein ACOC40_02475 [Thermoplasmatota archaeon]
MSAIVTILLESKDEDIKMNIDPDEYLGDILERSLDYWLIEENKKNFRFVKGTEILQNDQKVISSEIQKNDVLKLMSTEEIENKISDKNELNRNYEINVDQEIKSSKKWLSNNIGIEENKLEMIEMDEGKEFNRYVFTDGDDFFTIQTNAGKILRYLPRKLEINDEE